ncbi:MAG: leucyl/phenylalanyl-tRNA--protein transferase [Acidimicrobiia bacterium]|nr:leucyl/phenylalanyl-tRNA--protein transferase [Acidimicrobiia bacterium]
MPVVESVPIEPATCRWRLPPPESADEHGVVGVGADLEPSTLLAAYRTGLFPMPLPERRSISWWSPDPRGILPVDAMHVSRSLRRAIGRFEVRFDHDFRAVVEGCADPCRPHGWIDDDIIDAYCRLHDLGWAHSASCHVGGELVGGVYGVGIGGFFAGESMFHRVRDASKVALAALVERVRAGGGTLFDVQWTTPHLRSLGAVDVPRTTYLALLHDALGGPDPFCA